MQVNEINNKTKKDSYAGSQDKLWTYFQNQCPSVFEDAKPRMDFLIREIARRNIVPAPQILNIGAGSGYFEDMTKRLGWEISSLDPDQNTIDRLKEKGVKACKGYVERIPFNDASFDFVVASEVLEHLNDHQLGSAIREIARVMRVHAWFMGTVPYSEVLCSNQVLCPYCGQTFHRWGHLRSFDIEKMRKELSPIFNKVEVTRRAFVDFRRRGWSGKIKSLIRLILAYGGAAIANPSIYFIARK